MSTTKTKAGKTTSNAKKPKRSSSSKRSSTRASRTAPAKSTTTEASATRCTSCGSTNRSEYFRTQELPTGSSPSHVRLQWTKCTDCDQHRIDRTFFDRD